MHHLYNEKSFILGSYDIGETGKIFKLLTENLGLVQAKSTGIRKIESKLKNLTQDFSLIEASLVYGKGGFKMINADLIENLFYRFNEEQIILLKKFFRLIIKMSPEEDPESELFKIIESSIDTLKDGDVEIELLEIAVVLKILDHLGYVGDDDIYKDNTFEHIKKNQKKLIKLINESISQSQL